jgi:CRP-like cAMP-binding protein
MTISDLSCAGCPLLGKPLCPASHLHPGKHRLLPEFASLAPIDGPVAGSLADRRFGILKSGALMRLGPRRNGSQQGLDLILPGEPIGEVFLGNSAPEISALVPSRICWFDMARVEELSRAHAVLSSALLRATTVALERVQMFLWIRASLDSVQRVAALLLIAARRLPNRPGVSLRLRLAWPRKDIACLIGCSVETISRATHELERQGYVAIEDPATFRICNIAALAELAELDGGAFAGTVPSPVVGMLRSRAELDARQCRESLCAV